MIEYKYQKEVFSNEELGEYVGYSVIILSDGKCIEYIPDVFLEEGEARKYILLFNELELDPVHIYDVLDDIL